MCCLTVVLPVVCQTRRFPTLSPCRRFTVNVCQVHIYCAFLLHGCLHRDFKHNDVWRNSILQQSTPVCRLPQKVIVHMKSAIFADTFITTPDLKSCWDRHDLADNTVFSLHSHLYLYYHRAQWHAYLNQNCELIILVISNVKGFLFYIRKKVLASGFFCVCTCRK